MNDIAVSESRLIRYDAACRALAEAKAVDEVQELRSKADAMRVYAMQANNKTLEVDAAEIRIRAERRLGELIAEQKSAGGLNHGGRPTKKTGRDRRPVSVPTLSEAGISKDLSARAQKLAAVPQHEFEAEVGEWRERVEAENARVNTRLEAAADRAARPRSATPTTESMLLEITALREELEETKQNAAELADLLEGYTAVEGGEEAAAREIARLKGLLRTVETQRDTCMTTCNELKRTVAGLKRQLDKKDSKA